MALNKDELGRKGRANSTMGKTREKDKTAMDRPK